MKNFKIDPDSPFGKEIGFTRDKFDGYLWRNVNIIYISFIISKQEGRGNLRKLFQDIHEKEFTIKVPTPLARMKYICKSLGFKHKIEKDEISGAVEIMELKAKDK